MESIDEIKAEAARGGYSLWANVMYKDMAITIKDRLKAENPKSNPSIGLLPDDSWAIWYKANKENYYDSPECPDCQGKGCPECNQTGSQPEY